VPVPRPESPKSKRGHGGICLYYKNHLRDGIVTQSIDQSGILWIKLCKTFFQLDDDLYLCFVYIPPSNSKYYDKHGIVFFESIEQSIANYSDCGKVIVIGDLNARCGLRSDCIENTEEYREFIATPYDNDDVLNELPYRFSMDTTINSSGNKLLDLCTSSGLRIVNGRIGDDAGVGSYTFMSSLGCSLIDYVLVFPELFSLVDDFIVHDLHTCSPHTPIQLNIKTALSHKPTARSDTLPHGLNWSNDKTEEFKAIINDDIQAFESIVNKVVSSDVDIDTGINSFSTKLYEKALSVFGRKAYGKKRKNNKQWFNRECELAKQVFRRANKLYRRYNSISNAEDVVNKRKLYKKVKRKAMARFNIKQSENFSQLARGNPQKFWTELRKLKSTPKNNNSISEKEFLEHFKSLFSTDLEFHNEEIDEELNNYEIENDTLDRTFSCEEVAGAIRCLKTGKSTGIDNLTAEMFIECKDLFTPLLCKLFNYMISKCVYPDSWTKGIIVPVPKKGDRNDVNNYRGITLTSIFSKIFSILLDTRLRNWAETNEVLCKYQFGFRKKKSTTDCVFVLTSIIDNVLNFKKKKLYCAFIDFKKAFDVVYRNGIWIKLLKYGVSSKIVKMLQKIYENVKLCLRVGGSLSDFFNSYSGVKQGEPLSPLLFLFFINDMHDAIYDGNVDMFDLDDIKMFLLLFADDTVLFSQTKEGLQKLLDNLYHYCSQWGIQVNIAKTVAMVFKKGNRPEELSVLYDNCRLKVVTRFTYLGATLSANGAYFQAQKSLSKQALKALFSLNSLFDIVSLNITEKLKLFDSMIAPILHYGSEVWGFHKAPDIERVHLKFLKRLLNVKQQTTNTIVYGELGRFPMIIMRKIRILKFWSKLLRSPDSIEYRLFNLRDEHGNHINKWAISVHQLLDELGFSYLWSYDSITNSELQQAINRIHDQYLQQWFADLKSISKLETYGLIKDNFSLEKYLLCVKNSKQRTTLARLRCSAHSLMIEEGRQLNIDKKDRLCTKCSMNAIESEYHFVLVCPYYRQLRQIYLPRYYCHWPNLYKFRSLMRCSQSSILNKLAKYILEATVIRG